MEASRSEPVEEVCLDPRRSVPEKIRCGFSKAMRIRTSKEFSAVFSAASYKSFSPQITVLMRQRYTVGGSRLGIVVAKREIKGAVDRNQLKRWIREWFRCHHLYWLDGDYVFVIKRSALRLNAVQFSGLVQRLCSKFQQ